MILYASDILLMVNELKLKMQSVEKYVICLEVWGTKKQEKKKKREESCAESLSHLRLFATPHTVACQAPLFMGILEARILEWFAMPPSRVSLQPRDRTQVSHIAGRFFTVWATSEPITKYQN